MGNLKEEVEKIINDIPSVIGISAKELADKLVNLFDKEKKAYALEMCKQTVNNIDRSIEWLDPEEQCKQFIPQELQPQEEKNG